MFRNLQCTAQNSTEQETSSSATIPRIATAQMMATGQAPSTDTASPPVDASQMAAPRVDSTQVASIQVTQTTNPQVVSSQMATDQAPFPQAACNEATSAQKDADQETATHEYTTQGPAPTSKAGNLSNNTGNSAPPNPEAPAFVPQAGSSSLQSSIDPATHQQEIETPGADLTTAARALNGWLKNYEKLRARFHRRQIRIASLVGTIAEIKAFMRLQKQDLDHYLATYILQEEEIITLKNTVKEKEDEITEANYTIETHKIKEARRLKGEKMVKSKYQSFKEISQLKEEVKSLKARIQDLNRLLGQTTLYLENVELKKGVAYQKEKANQVADRSGELIAEAEKKYEEKVEKIRALEFEIRTLRVSRFKDTFTLHSRARASGVGPVLAEVEEETIAARTAGH
jgi:hypothetical protein